MMKLYLYMITFAFTTNVFGQVSEAQGEYSGCKYLEEPNYIVNNESVFFENCAIHRKVDVASEDLVVIEKGLAHDNQHMFYNGIKLEVSPQKPTALYTRIYSDRWSVYWINAGLLYRNEAEMCEIDTVTFQVLGEGYFRDKDHVYYRGKVMEDLDSETFIYNYPYSHDKKAVYLEGREKIINGKLQSINGYFFKDSLTVYEYNSNFEMDFKPRPDIKIQNTKAILKTKYGIINDTLYYLGEATFYHHVDLLKVKVFNAEVIGFDDTIIYRGYSTNQLDYNSVSVIEMNDYYCKIKDKKGGYEMTIERQKGEAKKVFLKPIIPVIKEKHMPYRYRNITQLSISGDTLYRNEYPFVLKSLLTESGVKSFDDLELVSVLSGYRMGCSQDTQSPSNFYILKNRQGYWKLIMSDENNLTYIGEDYNF